MSSSTSSSDAARVSKVLLVVFAWCLIAEATGRWEAGRRIRRNLAIRRHRQVVREIVDSRGTGRAPVLILGNSQVADGIDASRLAALVPRRVEVLAQHGSFVPEWYAITRPIWSEQRPRQPVLVFSGSAQFFLDPVNDYRNVGVLRMAEWYSDLEFSMDLAGIELKSSGAVLEFLAASCSRFLSRRGTFRIKILGRLGLMSKGFSEWLRDQATPENSNGTAPLRTMERTRRLIARIEETGVRAIFVLMPTTKRIPEREAVTRLLTTSRMTEVLDLQDWRTPIGSTMRDTVHLTDSSIAEFTEMLARRLGEALRRYAPRAPVSR